MAKQEPAEKTFSILMIEDNPGDVRLAREAFREGKRSYQLSVAPDGVEAMAFLRRSGSYAKAPQPDLILLDINLPRKNGLEVLAEIKLDPLLRHIPVIVLSSSQAEQDIRKVYDLHGNCYISKPGNLDRFTEVISAIENFWLAIVTLSPDQ